jgi:hypothetical protein
MALGFLAGILRFLPYVGPPMAAFLPILLASAIFPGWGHTWGTMAFYVVLELIVANLIEPLLYGAHVGLSPLAILVAAVFWTLIWGFPGLILSTPLTLTLVVMGRYVPSLNFLRILLGDQPEISRSSLYYQRLLASDQNEARIVSTVADTKPAVVCISALPPFTINHARALYQKLRSKMPRLDIVICLWHDEGDMQKTVRRLKVTKPQSVLTTLTEVLQYVTAKTSPSSIEPADLEQLPALSVASKGEEEPA